ncbi:MAG: secretin N-terminal domain-containing protein [Candidatus Omnitrophota bacterium]
MVDNTRQNITKGAIASIRRAFAVCISTLLIFSSPLEPGMAQEDGAVAADAPVSQVVFSSPLEPGMAQEDGAVVADAPISQAVVPTVIGGMRGKISLDLRNIEIIDALKFVAMKVKLNMVTTRNVTGRVTLMVEDVPVKDIFDIMLRSNNLAYAKTGEIYNIMTEKEYQAIYGENFADIRQVKSFRLDYAIPEQAFNLIDTLKSSIGRILVEPDSGTVMIMDTPDKIKEIEKALSTLEQKNLVRVFNLQYASAKEVEKKIKQQLDVKKVGSIDSDERSNQVIVQTFPGRMEEIENLINSLDQKTKEVIIDTTIVKIKLTDQFDSGIEWEGIFNVAKDLGMTYFGSTPFAPVQAAADAFTTRNNLFSNTLNRDIGSYPFSGQTAIPNSSIKNPLGKNMHLGIINQRRDFDAVINYVKTLSNTQILSNPKLVVVNNQEANIHVGERQAYVTTTTTTGSATSTVSEEVTFVDIGIKLSVTPTINDDGYVTMKVKPEVSSVVSTLTTPSGNEIPIIDTSLAETTVMVRSGATIIIGGLRKEEKVATSEGIPFLKDIPIIGLAFSDNSDKIERTELLVLITPHVVEGDRLISGDKGDFGYKSVKEYKEYTPFTAETGLEPPVEAPEDRIKLYQDYPKGRMKGIQP